MNQLDIIWNVLLYLEDPQILGLSLDAIGVFFLAKSFMFKGIPSILAEAFGNNTAGYEGAMSGNLATGMYRQRIEAIEGFVIIIAGFSWQVFGIAGENVSIDISYGVAMLLLSVLVPYFIRLRFLKTERILQRVEKADGKSAQ